MSQALDVEMTSKLEAIIAKGGPAGERAEDLLRQFQLTVAANPLEAVGFSRGGKTYQKQLDFLAAREPLQGFYGGNGSGKSHAGCLKAVLQLVDRDVVPAHLQEFKFWEPPVAGRVVVPKTNQIEGVALDKLRQLVPKGQLAGGSFDKALRGRGTANAKLFFKNGSSLEFKTSDQDRDAHAGVELRFVWFDEEPEGEHGKGIYTENVNRLRRFRPDAAMWFTMTPLFGFSWSIDEIFERKDQAGVHVTVASMRDNPFIDAEATIAQLAHLSDAEKLSVIEGLPAAFHGTVVNVTDEHIIPAPSKETVQKWDILEGFDPGIARGGWIWAGFDKQNKMTVFDEYYPSGETIEQQAKVVFAKRKAWGIEPLYTVIDPTARNRSLTNAQSVEAELGTQGIHCAPGQNDRMAGVLQLRSRLEHGGLEISDNCANTLMEAKRWVVAEHEESGKGDIFKTKGPDHLWDPIRYVCMEFLWNAYDTTTRGDSRKMWEVGDAFDVDWYAPQGDPPPLGSMM